MCKKYYMVRLVILMVFASCCGACDNAPDNKPKIETKINHVILDKGERKLFLMSNNYVVKTYKVAIGSNPIGPKRQEGDGKTPEGLYIIDRRNPKSSCYRSLHISYPSAKDIEYARRAGVRPGGDIMIHGILNGLGWIGPFHRLFDWTGGCIAVTNKEIEEIWQMVPDGMPIELRP